MLNMHPSLHVPVELFGLYSALPWRLRFYGDLEDPFNRLLLARDLGGIGQLKEFGVALDSQSLADRIGQSRKDLPGIVQAFYDELLKGSGKSRIGDKTPNNGPYLERIARTCPEAGILHLVRDGRDVALSSMDSRGGINFRNTFELGLGWGTGNLRRAEFGVRHPGRYLRVYYEDLVRDPEGQLRGVCEFLGEPYDSRMLEHAGGEFARKNAVNLEHHANLARPVMPHNVGKWRREMSPRHRCLYEALSGKALEAFGYATGARPPVPGWWVLGMGQALATAGRRVGRGVRATVVNARWLIFTLVKRRIRKLRLRGVLGSG
jgi:hypothetical protein